MQKNKEIVELTILMPCLNEEKNIAGAIRAAQTFLKENLITGEILIVDNNSSDQSSTIARSLGARVVTEINKGYGNAVRCGIHNALGVYTILGDCDTTYNFENLSPFLDALQNGNSLVIGNRFAGGIEKGAMPFLHRYVGIPFLSWLGRKRYRIDIRDFHCGLRGFRTSHAKKLNLKSEGMEFATEIIARFADSNLPIIEVPTTLSVSQHPRRSHLRTIRDGFRHLIFILKSHESF